MIGISMIFIYFLLLALGQTLSQKGLVDPVTGLWGPNITLGSIGCLLYYLVITESQAFKIRLPWRTA